MGNIMISDKDGNVVPVAALKMNAGLRHAGNNVWRVSAFKQVTKQIINSFTNYITFTRDRSVTKDVVTNLETRTQPKPVSKIEATQRTRNAFEQITRTVTNIFMATLDQTRSVAASEHTATKQVTLIGTHPESSVTDIVTRERTVTRLIGFGFLVTGPAIIIRGTPFDLDIQSYKVQSGQLDTDYVPDSIVQIDAAYSDPLDNHTPYSTDNTGWVDGKKTVSVTVDGGADSDTVTFWIHDPNSSREGFLQIPIAAAVTEITGNAFQVYRGEDVQTSAGVDDWDSGSDAFFRTVQVNAQAAFEIDNTLQAAGGFGPGTRFLSDRQQYVQMDREVNGGYMQIPISDPQKLGLKAVRLKGKFISRLLQQFFSPVAPAIYSFSPYAFSRRLVISPSEAANTYPNGAAMKAMSPTTSVEFTWINQQQATSGGTAQVPVLIYIDIPKSWVADLVGNTLYLWCYVVEKNFVPYTTEFASLGFDNTLVAGHSGFQNERWESADARLVLYT